jgi:hypothetical protein
VALIFDQVAVKKSGGYNLISATEWLALPLAEQFDLVTSAKVEFLMAGERVRTVDAMRSMRNHRS